MGRKNNSGTLVGPPCGMVNGRKITLSLQYGWSGGIMNMQLPTRFDLRGGTQIEVTLGNGRKRVGLEAV